MRHPARFPRGARAAGAASRFTMLLAVLGMMSACGHRGPTTAEKMRDRIILGDRLLQTQNYTEAQRIFAQVVKAEPKNAEAQYYLGVCHFYLGDYPRAESALKEALRLNKRNPDAHNVLGLVYKQMGDKEQALEEYRLALAEPARRAPETIYLNLALCLDDLAKTEDAIASLRRAVEENPKYYPAHWELAKILDRQDQTRAAIEEYEIAAPQYASDPNFHYRLGLAYFRDHQMDRAREHLTKVLAAIPGTEKAVKAREYLDLMAAAPAPRPQGSPPPTGRP